jgi:3-hydroxyacyl-[acyl-carrier-protein] dehydratase
MITLDYEGILEYQKNRPPYLMIDHANCVIPGKIANGYKKLKNDEWFFKVHWKGDPNMPGMLQIESLVQMCALTILTLDGNKGKIVFLSSATNLKFSKKIVPGNTLTIKTTLNSWKRGVGKCSGIGSVNDEIACKADFSLILPEEFNRYTR